MGIDDAIDAKAKTNPPLFRGGGCRMPYSRGEVLMVIDVPAGRSKKKAAGIHTLYRTFDADEVLLYIGVTKSPPARFRSHQGDKDWWSMVKTIKMEQFSSRALLLAAEKAAIKAEAPRYNVMHNNGQAAEAHHTTSPGLIGKWFHTTKECGHGLRIAEWQGHIDSTPTPDSVLVELFDWMAGESNGYELLSLHDFIGRSPVLYGDASAMRYSYDRGQLRHTSACGNSKFSPGNFPDETNRAS